MSYVTIYRIHKRNDPYQGPFTFASEDLDVLANMLDCKDPNDMALDEASDIWDSRNIDFDYVFGFLQESSVYEYFDEIMRDWLHKDGFVLSQYKSESTEVIQGSLQCLFKPDSSKSQYKDLI